MFDLSPAPLDAATLRRQQMADASGGFVCFEGWVRNHNDGRDVRGLQYEAYEALALSEGQRIIDEALQKFAIRSARCQHRIGALEIGELAVWVGTDAAHRDAAFKACRYIIDEVKKRVPIWKKELYADGDTTWVDCREQET
ncbi:MAG: molybdenum cofactor biosynthesis protein MoaE [Gammaproteobacteria bacterium]|nr:molybdenum cofactor biosynthesis protein MoaE [Gammaproteobacteria bacterium]